MSQLKQRIVILLGTILASVAVAVVAPHGALAGGVFRQAAIGGVSIDAEGVVSQPTVEARARLLEFMRQNFRAAPPELAVHTQLRKVSLRRLELAIEDALHNKFGMIPDEVKYLAGIQRIAYVFVYPEENDIVIAGPGEGWTLDDNGHVVGETSGLPVISLDDLVIALRSARSARDVGITCSIEPTREGRLALRQMLRRQNQFHPRLVDVVERTMGPQMIKVTGVPTDSHFARVLVSCDYRMKRIAMNLEPAAVSDLPGFLDLVKQRRGGLSSMNPRWWLACNYEPLARGREGLSWQLRGPGVKVLTENDFIAADGTSQRTGKSDPVAQEWAELMTAKYDELAREDMVFGQLRNVMDLCVVAALIEKERLLERAGCELPLLTSRDSDLMTDTWFPAKTVATQCSFVKIRRKYLITASGGVDIGSWEVASKIEQRADVENVRQQAMSPATGWWWN